MITFLFVVLSVGLTVWSIAHALGLQSRVEDLEQKDR